LKLEEYIKLEQTRTVYKNLNLILLGTSCVTLATFWMFWSGNFSKTRLTVWITSAILLVSLRWLSSRRFDPNKVNMSNYQHWLNLSLFWSFLGGVHWGLIPTFFLDSQVTIYTLFSSFVLSGYTASAISTNAAYTPAFVAFAFPASMLFAMRFIYQGDEFHLAIAYMIIFFFVVSCLLSRTAQSIFRNARELNYKNMALMDELVIQKEAAETATQSKDRFLAAASHDLRQPLHSSGLLLSALDQYVHDTEGKELISDLHQSNEALNHSFNSLLDVSRLDAGVVEVRNRHVSLNNLVAPLAREYLIDAQEKGLEFICEGEQVTIFTDPILLERILHNLISNAFNHTKNGKITLSWKILSDTRLRLMVCDTGTGIDANELEEIFSEYYQINNPERDRNKGFGLGLAIVKRLCGILGINIFVSSELSNSTEVSGTKFALFLPLGKHSKAKKNSEQVWSLANLSGTFVLVIDDDQSVIRSMNKLLESWGCKVILAESEKEAIEQLVALNVSPDIIIADYRLRENKTGIEAINRISEELNHSIPSIIVTGDTSPDRLKNLTSSGFPVLHKPVSVALLRSAIQRQLGANAPIIEQ